MKFTLFFVAIGLLLVACTEKQQGKAATPPSLTTPGFVKATPERPATIPVASGSTEPCSIDAVNEQPAQEATTITDKAKVKLVGWAGNVATGTSPQEVFVELDGPGKAYFKASRGLKRPDVATHFNKPGLVDAGWEAYADLSGFAAGTYKTRIIQVEGQSGLVCDTKRSIVIN